MASSFGIAQPFRYRGYVYDVETEKYYLKSRYYSPKWKRFLGIDKYMYDTNAYVYSNNNPIRYVDNNGCVLLDDS